MHGTPVAPVVLMRMLERPEILYDVHKKSSYQSQSGPRLAKYFT